MVRVLLIFSYSIDLDGAEFTSVHYLQKMLSGKTLYGNPESYPFAVVIYTPLYLYLLYGICKLFSMDTISNIYSIYVASRILSFIFVIISVLYVDKFVKKQTDAFLIRISCIAVFLILLTQHIYVVRTDSMKIAFFVMFLYYYFDYFYYSKQFQNLIIAFICAIISIAAKQDALFYILIVHGIHFLFHRKKDSFFATAISLCSYVLLFISMSLIFGKYFNVSIFQFNAQVLSQYEKSYNIWVIVFNTVRLLPFYILFFYNIIKLKEAKYYELIRIVSVCGILAAFAASFFMLRPGSYLNYTYELISISMFSFILFLSAKQPVSNRFVRLFSFYMLLVLCTGIITRTYSYSTEREAKFKKEYTEYYNMRKQLLPLLQNNESIFSLDLGLSLFVADKNVIYGQEYHLDRMVYAHLGLKTKSKLLYNSSEVYDSYFSNGSVNYILAKENKENKTIMESFYPKYKKEKQFGEFELYVFKN